ncbi:ABC transporter substrate-binding protein [Aliagarivorans taiwanensis]|uniref:ABC transporter substrate-binding protein n=1 Tax=Aliagarivorans taiwanensis TaxID=561966 RepID=UPI0003F94235|nr:ABC transporter substrate-binding protein [Aliagarivorans taiwanensis]
MRGLFAFGLFALIISLTAVLPAQANWQEIEQQADGQTVYFNAWAGSENINSYIRWVAQRVKQEHGIELKHVKISDTANVVSRIIAEHASGREQGGSVDLLWVNGENFRTLKQAELLYGPFAEELPNLALTDQQSASLQYDFSEPVAGMESPWGGAQLTFYYDSERINQLPRLMAQLLEFAKRHPGQFSYPAPPDFYGTTFIKQALWEWMDDPALLQLPANPERFQQHTAALWRFLDQLHPLMWRGGQVQPNGAGQMQQLVNDGELTLAFTFNPNEPASSVEQGRLPDSVRSYTFAGGTIANTHFVAIPFNSSVPQAAMVVANFLLSPEAQARKADLNHWGDPSILDMRKLDAEQRALFVAQQHPAMLSAEDRARTLAEPHISWLELLEAEWLRRYGK